MKSLEKILRKFELKRRVSLELGITKEDFINGLKKQMKSETESPLFSGLEIFSSDITPFFGDFTADGFTLRGRRVAGKSVRHVALAKGVLDENENRLSVSIEINAFRGIFSFALMLLVPLYICLFLICLYLVIFKLEMGALLSLVFIPLHSVLMIGVPVFLLSKAARILDQKLLQEIEEIRNSVSTNLPLH